MVLPVSLEQFFRLFFADDAKYSLDFYQDKFIGDRDIDITGWRVVDGVMERTVTFTHPIKNNSLGLGPSESRTSRKQQLRRFGNLGFTIENKTVCAGIPAADAFYVQDHWLIEATGENEVTLSTRFGSTFTKRAMFRALIEKNIVKETSEWFSGYQKMLQDATMEREEEEVAAEVQPPVKAVVKVDNTLVPVTDLLQTIALSLDRGAYVAAGMFLVLSLILLIQLFIMRETMTLMRQEITLLREEVGIIAAAVARQPQQ